MRPDEPNRTRHREVYGAACFLGGVASPVSIKARSRLSLESAIEQYESHAVLWGSVNRHNMQYFTDLKRRTPILDVPPLGGQGTGDKAETQPAHHRVLVGMHRHLGLGYDMAHRVKELVKGCHTRPLGCSYVV